MRVVMGYPSDISNVEWGLVEEYFRRSRVPADPASTPVET